MCLAQLGNAADKVVEIMRLSKVKVLAPVKLVLDGINTICTDAEVHKASPE